MKDHIILILSPLGTPCSMPLPLADDTEQVDHASVIIPLVVFLLIVLLVRQHRRQPDYSHIPSVGFSRFPFCYIGAFKFFFNAKNTLNQGYHRHGRGMFKIADFVRWNIVITSPTLLEGLKNAPENEIHSVDTHMRAGLSASRAHSTLLATKLTRALPVVLSEMREELVEALDNFFQKITPPPTPTDTVHEGPGIRNELGTTTSANVLPNVPQPSMVAPHPEKNTSDAGWESVLVADAMTEVVSRVCNRVIFGPHLCQSPDLVLLNQKYIRSTGLRSGLHAVLPTPLFSYAVDLFSGLSWKASRLRNSLERIIQQRRDKPSKQPPKETARDLLSSFISEPSSSPRTIANALLTLDLQAVPFCAVTLTNSLHRLVRCSLETLKAMRQEVEMVVREEGWTMRGLERMVTIDSFLKETMRVDGIHALTMRRTTLVPYTLSDGTCLPIGTFLSAGCNLDSSSNFDARRFLPEAGMETGPRYQLTTAAPEFLAWGLGKGACPGRFFAGAVMKMVLAQIVLGFDVRAVEGELEGIKVEKQQRWIAAEMVPDLQRRVLICRRQG